MKISFSFETIYGTFSDCLNLPDDHNLTNDEIETMKTQRRDAWLKIIQDSANDPPFDEEIPIDPTVGGV